MAINRFYSRLEEPGGDWSSDRFPAGMCRPLRILPARYVDLLRQSASLEGERKLMLAVLWAGIHDYLAYANAGRGERRARFAEVYRWIHDRSGGQELFSYEGLCEGLGIDPARLRRQVERLRRRPRPSPVRAVRRRRAVRGSAASLTQSVG
jgi:hypothetical protein